MKKPFKHVLALLLMLVSVFSFTGCDFVDEVVWLFKIAFGGDFRQDYLEGYNLTEEDVLPIKEIESDSRYEFNGEIYESVNLDESHDKHLSGRYYSWKGTGGYLDTYYRVNKEDSVVAKPVGLKKGKIGCYVGAMSPFVFVSKYDTAWDMIEYHLRTYAKVGVEIPLILQATFTGMEMQSNKTDEKINYAFDESVLLKDIIDLTTVVEREKVTFAYASCYLDVEGFPYLQSGYFDLFTADEEVYVSMRCFGNNYRIKDAYQDVFNDLLTQLQQSAEETSA